MSAFAMKEHQTMSLNHLIGGDQETGRDGEPQRPRGFQVDNGFVLGRRLHRKVGWLVAAQDAVDIGRRPPILVVASRDVRWWVTRLRR
jgi:hypothetical protein